MNRKELYRKLLDEVEANPRFKVQGYLRDNHPRILEALRNANGITAKRQVGFEHIHRWAYPNAKGKCETCKGPTKYDVNQKGFKSFCSTSCVQNAPSIKAKKMATNLERRGVEWPTQSAVVQKKVRATTLKKFGHEHAAQSKASKDKARKTNQKRRGVDNASQSEAVKQKKVQTNLKRTGGKHETPFADPKSWAKSLRTMVEKYGVEYAGQSPELRAKFEKTMMERWGASNPSQVPELFQKARVAMRAYYKVRVGSRELQLQGYEDMAVRQLLGWKVPASKIHEVKKGIPYSYAKKSHVYHADFKIVHGKHEIFVEVKSDYTSGLSTDEEMFPEVLAKAKAVVKAGKPILLLVMRGLKHDEVGYDRHAPKGERVGRITHFMFSTPKRKDWTLHSSREAKKELKERLQNWLRS